MDADSNDPDIKDLSVGESPCTFVLVCDTLSASKSAAALWKKLSDLSIKLEIPKDKVVLINPSLLNETKTHYTVLYEILEAWRGKEGDKAKLTKLLGVLENLDLRDCADSLRLKFKPLENITDSMTWNDLSDSQKDKISNKFITFQGNPIKLGSFSHLEELDSIIIAKLARGESIELVNNQVPEPPEYYIPRILKSRNKLRPEIFKADCKDIFLVQNTSRSELTNLANGNRTDVSINQVRRLTVRFILLEHEPDYEKLCNLSKEPVHWIRVGNNSYEWVKSSMSIEILQKYIHEQQDTLTIDELASFKNKINILSDSPGMGKTVALSKITQEMIRIYPATTIVRFIILKEFVQALGKKEVSIESLSSLIAEQSSTFEFGRKVVKKAILTGECILMFDGFDEVLIHQVDTAKKILQAAASLESVRVFVTTRLHMREELENTLQALGSLFVPLNESDQVNFLIQFWKSKGINTNESVEEFAKYCLNALSENVTSFESQIAGIPLQCRMLAETYMDEAETCSEKGHHVYENPSCSNIIVTSIFEMYKTHMEMRFQNPVMCHDDTSFIKRLFDFLRKSDSKKDVIKRAHIYHALELLFPEEKAEFQHLISSNFPVTMNELCRFGILESTNSNSVRFVHRTFAEYLVAWFVVDDEFSNGSTNFILSQIFSTSAKSPSDSIHMPLNIGFWDSFYYSIETFRFNLPVVCYFINEFTRNQPQSASQLDNISTMIYTNLYSQCSSKIFASICHNYPYVMVEINKLLDSKNVIHKEENKDLGNLLLLTAKYCDVDSMAVFCDGLELSEVQFLIYDKNNVDYNFKITPLHIAVRRGHYNLVEYLANKFGSGLADLRHLFHFCVVLSREDNQATISSKKQIIQLLLTKSKQWIEEAVGEQDNTTPILQRGVHWELLECLIKVEANVNVHDCKQETILHKLSLDNLSAETYHHIVSLLCEHGFEYINHPTIPFYYMTTPFHLAVQNIELLDDTVILLQKSGAEINAVDVHGFSVLHCAIVYGRSVRLIRKLIEYGANIHQNVENYNDSSLHVGAKCGNTGALQFLLEDHRMDVNLSNRYGKTSLHRAVEDISKNHEHAQHTLITRGADVNATDSNKLTPFLHAFQCSGISLDIIKLMEEHGLNASKEIYSNALKIAICNNENIQLDNNFERVMSYFIEKGGTFDVDGCSPWQFKFVENVMKYVVQATEVTAELLHRAKNLKLVTAQELSEIELAKESLKPELFYAIVKEKEGSFEKVVLWLIGGNQVFALLHLRDALSRHLDDEVQKIMS